MPDADIPAAEDSEPLVARAADGCDPEAIEDCEDPLALFQQFEGGHPATKTLRLLGRSHALAVLVCLLYDDQTWWRFTELEEALDVSTNTLSKRLEELTEVGLVRRESYDEIPPHVEYAATGKARELSPVFRELRSWAQTHECDYEECDAARERFDRVRRHERDAFDDPRS